MSFWQILLCSLVCAYALEIKPSYNEYKQTDIDASSFFQENTEIGDLIHEYTGINPYSNLDYLISEAQSLHTYAVIFIAVAVIIALIIAIGAIGKKLDRRIIEGLAILNTLACCWICKSSTDLCEAIIRDGVTMQTIAWIGRLLWTDIYAAMDMMIRIVWILPIILIFKHFFYHRTLNEYYLADTGNRNENESATSPVNAYSPEAVNPTTENETMEDSEPAEQTDVFLPSSSSIKTKEPENKQKESIETPEEPTTSAQIDQEQSIPVQKKSPYEYEDDDPSNSKRWLIITIGVLVLVGFILIWQHTRNITPTTSGQEQTPGESQSESELFEEKSEAIVSQLTEKYGNQVNVIGKYPDLSHYIAFVLGNRLLFEDVDGAKQIEFDFPLRIGNSDRCGTPTKAFDSKDKSKILIIGENGGNEFADMAFLLEYNPLTNEIRELGWGLNLEEQKNWIKITRRWTTFWDEENFNHEYAFIDIYYDLNGDLIPSPLKGDSYQFKGKIDDKYAVTMQLSIKNNKIYGEYFCDKNKSENVLFLYGGISSGRDIVLLEFDDKGEQTYIFQGRFGSNSLEGTFTNNAGVEMPFKLYPVVDSSKSQSSTNTSTKTYIPNRDAEFPGGMVGLGQYITENLQYPVNAKEKGISGNVRVSYIIDKDGSITDVKVIESVDPELDKEAIRLISSMPKWKPGIRNSKYVKMRTSTVIRFELK